VNPSNALACYIGGLEALAYCHPVVQQAFLFFEDSVDNMHWEFCGTPIALLLTILLIPGLNKKSGVICIAIILFCLLLERSHK